MRIGVVGLGLIGGSLAQAYHRAGHKVYGFDISRITLDFVRMEGSIDEILSEENVNTCDAVFLAIPPEQAVSWLKKNAGALTASTLVVDCCGVKRQICREAFQLMETTDLQFMGGHPMAGVQEWGFKNSTPDLFQGAVFAMVPKDSNDIRLMEKVKALLVIVGFKTFQVMTPEEHDRVIAFTSQLSHVVSNAFIKSDTSRLKACIAAGGSYRDMTRVAYLNDEVWTELMMDNRDNLGREIDGLMKELSEYREALASGDRDHLCQLLKEGRIRKEESEAEMGENA